MRPREYDDVVPSAWRDLMALLWSAPASCEVIELIHEIHRSPEGQPERYAQWIRLMQSSSARASGTASNLALAIRSAVPKLAFEPVEGVAVTSDWVARVALRPACIQLLLPEGPDGVSVLGRWAHPSPMPDWKLTVPLVEPLCPAMRIQCRFSAAELSETERVDALRYQQLVLAGRARVVHPDAPLDLNGHHAGLAAELLDQLHAWLRGQERGYRFEVVLSTPRELALPDFAIRRVAHDLFRQTPWAATFLDDGEALEEALTGMPPLLHSQGLPGVFVPGAMLVQSFGVPELSEAPPKMPEAPGAWVGEVGGKPLLLPHAQLASHTLVVGGSGTGKSSTLLRILQQDAVHGLGIGLIDPHGETADRFVATLPSSRREDVVWVDVEDTEFSAAINPMEGTREQVELRSYVAGQLLHLIKNNGEVGNSWGPAAENHLRHCFLLAMCHPSGGTIRDAAMVLEDDDFADWLLAKTQDASLKQHFKHWRSTSGDSGYASWRPWLLARLHPFSTSPALVRILQRPSTLDLHKAMNDRRIVVFRMGKAALSELDCQLLGTTLLLEFQRAALARARQTADQRPPFRLVVDEFQSFASEATPGLFREARKYNLGLVVATQSLNSLVRPTVTNLKDAVLANTATKVIFRVSPADAHLLDDYTGPEFSAAQLMRTRNHEAVVTLASGEMPPVRARMKQADEVEADDTDLWLRSIRSRFGEPVEEVERFLLRRHAKMTANPSLVVQGVSLESSGA